MQVDILNNAGIGFIIDKAKKYLGWIILAIYLFFQGCNKSEIPDTTKPINRSFKPVKPNNTNLGSIDTIILTNFVKSKPIIVYKNNEVNKELAEENYNLQMAYTNASDSIERLKLYINAIQLKSFEKTFEDDYLKADIKGISQGEVKEIGLNYTIKPQHIPETKFRLLLGGGFGINKELNQGVYKINAGYQNRKGNILRASYMKIGNQTFGLAEYDFSIWNRKK